jgi:RNA ligase (TIGR02306 family)
VRAGDEEEGGIATMSEWKVEVVRLGPIVKHPNADTLGITEVHGGYPVIVRLGEYSEGDLAVYVPIDSIVPDTEAWSFLNGHRRIKAKRLRGVFSMGLLTKIPGGVEWVEGQDVDAEMAIEKYEPEAERQGGAHFRGPCLDDEPDPGIAPVYTDLEGWRKWKSAIADGEDVVCTEKIHGANARYVFSGDRLWIGSRTRWKKLDAGTHWNQAAVACDLATKLATVPDVCIYGEVYGQVQDLKYGVTSGVRFRMFDALDCKTRRYFDHDDMLSLARSLGIDTAPELYRGPWGPDVLALAEGTSTLPGAAHTREGFVVKPLRERFDLRLGRVILKVVGEGYMLRKEAA